MTKEREIHAIETPTMPSMHVALYHSRNKLQRDLRDKGIEQSLSTGCDAQTFSNEIDGTTIHFVLIEGTERELWEELALLAHEATHVAMRYLADLGEEEAADEELAYAVQAAAGCLFDMHLSWLDKQKGKKNEKED